jgi:DNA-binding MarR family transcriptional regulator
LIDALDRELSKFDISAPQLIVLASVANNEADSASGLCKSISYDPGAMTRMIDRLEQKGLVRRVPNVEDRRATNLEITTAGKALYPQLVAAKERCRTVPSRFSGTKRAYARKFLESHAGNTDEHFFDYIVA